MILMYILLGMVCILILFLIILLIKLFKNIHNFSAYMKDELSSIEQYGVITMQILDKVEHHEQYFKRIVQLEETTNQIQFLLKEIQNASKAVTKTRKTTAKSTKEKDESKKK